RKAERATVTVDDEELEGELRNEKAYAAASSVPGRRLKRIDQQRAAGRPTGKRAARGSGRPTGKPTGKRRRCAERANLVIHQAAPERREEVRVSQELDSSAGTSAVAPTPGSGRPATPSATKRVRARLARRITAQRAASVKQVLEPLVAVHRELHPNADLALLQRAYAVAEELHRDQRRKSGAPYITHPLTVATILAELGMDTTTLVAALLHDTVEDTGYSLDQ